VGRSAGATVLTNDAVTTAGVVGVSAAASVPATTTIVASGSVSVASSATAPITSTIAAAGVVGASTATGPDPNITNRLIDGVNWLAPPPWPISGPNRPHGGNWPP
jgi:hypothetical protein